MDVIKQNLSVENSRLHLLTNQLHDIQQQLDAPEHPPGHNSLNFLQERLRRVQEQQRQSVAIVRYWELQRQYARVPSSSQKHKRSKHVKFARSHSVFFAVDPPDDFSDDETSLDSPM